MGLAYARAGSGPPLVLLHGIGHRRQAWDAVLDRLTPHRDVIVVDLPGHGESPPLDLSRGPAIGALTDAMVGLLDELGLERPHVAGNSLGGRIALEAGAAGRAASVTAVSPAGFWRSERELAYAKGVFWSMQALGGRLAPYGPTLVRSTPGRAVLYATIVSHPSRLSPEQALGDMAAFMAARPAMKAILAEATPFTATIPDDIPVTVVWGSRDHLLSPRQAVLAKTRLPHATFIRLPDCGHVPMTDDPAMVANVLLQGSDPGHRPVRSGEQSRLSRPAPRRSASRPQSSAPVAARRSAARTRR